MTETTKGLDEKFCSECAAVIKAKAEICPKCGVRQASATVSAKSKTTTAVLALLLGGLGMHKFYLGKPIWGILYLLFCWTFVPSVLAFIEGIYYLSMKESTFQEKYAAA